MLKYFINLIKTIANPLLYYVDKSGNSIFRNYCLFKDTGCMYKTSIPKMNAGKTLEYRLELDKKLKRVYILTPLVLYFIFIHVKISIVSILFFEFLWIAIIFGCRVYASYIYSQHLIKTFGKYEMVDFKPSLKKSKYREFVNLYFSRAVALVILCGLLLLPSLLIKFLIKHDVSSKSNFKQVIGLSKLYFTLYPRCEEIYDMQAYAKYMEKDYEGALEDYLTVLDFSGKKLQEKDTVRLANLLYLKSILTNPNEALDLFNEYSTKKDASILDSSKILWIKSMFSLENNIPEAILQDYDDLLASLDNKDYENRFYISSDKAYILYLMGEYEQAIEVYNLLISYASANKDKYSKELKSFYAERGFSKLKLGETKAADSDFLSSEITPWEMKQYEPAFSGQGFIADFK